MTATILPATKSKHSYSNFIFKKSQFQRYNIMQIKSKKEKKLKRKNRRFRKGKRNRRIEQKAK